MSTPTSPSQNLLVYRIKSRSPWLQPPISHKPRTLIILSTAEAAGTAGAAGTADTAGAACTAGTLEKNCTKKWKRRDWTRCIFATTLKQVTNG